MRLRWAFNCIKCDFNKCLDNNCNESDQRFEVKTLKKRREVKTEQFVHCLSELEAINYAYSFDDRRKTILRKIFDWKSGVTFLQTPHCCKIEVVECNELQKMRSKARAWLGVDWKKYSPNSGDLHYITNKQQHWAEEIKQKRSFCTKYQVDWTGWRFKNWTHFNLEYFKLVHQLKCILNQHSKAFLPFLFLVFLSLVFVLEVLYGLKMQLKIPFLLWCIKILKSGATFPCCLTSVGYKKFKKVVWV